MDSIIFDVDGTLWDSTEVVAASWTKALKEEASLDVTITSARLHQLFGQVLPDIARQLFPDLSQARQLELIQLCCEAEHRALLQTPPKPYEGLSQTLQELSKRYGLYLVSNCEAGYIDVFLKTTGLSHLFKGQLCAGDTGHGKASNILQVIQEHRLKSPVYVGDTDGDYKATKAAGIPFVFASYGFGEVLTPDYSIKKPLDLLTLF